MDSRIPLIAVVGPTASGKTGLGIELAKRFNGEVVSADSMQVYRELSIATAKPTKEEMQSVPHHMIDVASVCDEYSAAIYCEGAAAAIEDIHCRGKLPILVGGTGLYVDSLLCGNDFSLQDSDKRVRERLNEEYDTLGGDVLYERLKACDEGAAEMCHVNNKKRLVRYLELYELTGLTANERSHSLKERKSPYDVLYLMPNCRQREHLYERINERVDKMIENGLVNEVKSYYNIKGVKTASQAIGCKEIRPYLLGESTLCECVEKLKQSTRRYAKRQLTWFLRNERLNVLYTDEMSRSEFLQAAFDKTDEFLKRGCDMNEA